MKEPSALSFAFITAIFHFEPENKEQRNIAFR